MLTPAIRAMFYLSCRCAGPLQPWRCLCRGSVQMTRTTPLRRMILQFRQIFFTDANTFMCASLGPERDPRPRQVVRRELDRQLVARKELDDEYPQLTRVVHTDDE